MGIWGSLLFGFPHKLKGTRTTYPSEVWIFLFTKWACLTQPIVSAFERQLLQLWYRCVWLRSDDKLKLATDSSRPISSEDEGSGQWLTYVKRLYVVASDASQHTNAKRTPCIVIGFPPCGWRLSLVSSIKEESTNRHQSDYLLLSTLIRRVMHSRISFSLCERIVEGRSKGLLTTCQSSVIGVLSDGYIETWRRRLLLCKRRLCKNLWISASGRSIVIELLLSFESMVRTQGVKGALRVCLRLHCYVSTYLSDSNLVDSASSIRLSQRLSHACLSINNFIRETANGSLYQL